jgi:hypothetical protein
VHGTRTASSKVGELLPNLRLAGEGLVIKEQTKREVVTERNQTSKQ